ncbi:hypothetical protein [Streptomyces sp. bgisy031]|uniref:hypothetical protein n=1 Tax=Streptomyces sp. bgisy031 TaxID=3413772 RepID=UPI003D7665A8
MLNTPFHGKPATRSSQAGVVSSKAAEDRQRGQDRFLAVLLDAQQDVIQVELAGRIGRRAREGSDERILMALQAQVFLAQEEEGGALLKAVDQVLVVSVHRSPHERCGGQPAIGNDGSSRYDSWKSALRRRLKVEISPTRRGALSLPAHLGCRIDLYAHGVDNSENRRAFDTPLARVA